MRMPPVCGTCIHQKELHYQNISRSLVKMRMYMNCLCADAQRTAQVCACSLPRPTLAWHFFATQHFLMWEEPSGTTPTNQFAWPGQKATVLFQNALRRKHITTWSDEITVIWLVTAFKAFYVFGILLILARFAPGTCLLHCSRAPTTTQNVWAVAKDSELVQNGKASQT